MKLQTIGIAGCLLASILGCEKVSKDTSKVIASVAGEKITENVFEATIKSMVNDEAKAKDVLTKADMRETRNEFLSQLLKGKALVALAKAQGLDKDPQVKIRLEQASAQAYLQTLMDRRMPKNGPSDAELKVLYDQQVAQLKAMGQDKGVPPFEQVKSQLPTFWKKQQEGKIFEQLMTEASQKSPITYTEGYKPKGEK